jgi:hypothetical protein
LLSLVALGAQDSYLTGTPQITFFRVVYRRHTNFAVESIVQTANGQMDFSKRTSINLSRNGDLITNAWLQVTLPALDQRVVVGGSTSTYVNYVNSVGHAMLKSVEIDIGGQKVDKHFDAFYEVMDELEVPSEKRAGLNEMLGRYDELDTSTTGNLVGQSGQRTYYVPLRFWWNKLPGQALPLLALMYHDVRINIEFRSALELVKSDVALTQPTSGGAPLSFIDASLWVDYVYCDAAERKRFAGDAHEYLIEQVQFTGDESIPASVSLSTQKIRLAFNHPVKELIWVVTPETSAAVDAKNGNMLFDFGQIAGVDYIQSAKLMLNGHDRYTERPGTYHRLVQPYQHHPHVPSRPVYVYSFALEASSHQPSGATNFSRIDNAQLYLTTRPNMPAARVKVLAINYNVFRIQGGMGGLAYCS